MKFSFELKNFRDVLTMQHLYIDGYYEGLFTLKDAIKRVEEAESYALYSSTFGGENEVPKVKFISIFR